MFNDKINKKRKNSRKMREGRKIHFNAFRYNGKNGVILDMRSLIKFALNRGVDCEMIER